MNLMTIGEFAERTRLSPKALRLYDELKLVVPARVDTNSGYRLYAEDQVEPARLVGLLRRAGMPLALIGSVVTLDGPDAARAIAEWWKQTEAGLDERRAVVAYLQARLTGEDRIMFDVDVRSMPERRLATICRHVHANETDLFFDHAFERLRGTAPGIPGIAGVPFLVFYGEVSDDSDGPIELCRPVASGEVRDSGDFELRIEPAHDEAYVRLALKDMGWPAMLPACDALESWVSAHQRQPAGALRQVLIADQRTAGPDTVVCDLSVPLR
jgi:DNA-binding transcriptional MerR regulator